ncbi:hypothetical protein AB0C89_37550 [Streptomyces sp. NPDC048491]|uniref:hypothetical protein n=1 Tax=Streptomyces sp. NPDC048491 TaxID=3157207 RepID=UPI00344A9771
MSTARRRLGTGPSATTTTVPAGPAPRLLPVERVEAVQLEDVERQAVADRRGRRVLGPGVSQEPKGSPEK